MTAAPAQLYYEEAHMTALYALVGVTRAWRIDLADGATVTFDGFINTFGQPELNGDDEVMIDMTIAVDGLPTFTPAPAPP